MEFSSGHMLASLEMFKRRSVHLHQLPQSESFLHEQQKHDALCRGVSCTVTGVARHIFL